MEAKTGHEIQLNDRKCSEITNKKGNDKTLYLWLGLVIVVFIMALMKPVRCINGFIFMLIFHFPPSSSFSSSPLSSLPLFFILLLILLSSTSSSYFFLFSSYSFFRIFLLLFLHILLLLLLFSTTFFHATMAIVEKVEWMRINCCSMQDMQFRRIYTIGS